jgi:addiction module HigA family antidote
MAKMNSTSCQPNYAIAPGETLRETLETIGMTQAELADRTGRPKKTINEIITGKAAITAETALQLERVLGIPASFWNNLERNYREALARLKEEEELQKQEEWANNFPIDAMAKMGLIPKENSKIGKVRAVLNFFGVARIHEWKLLWENPEAAYRKSTAYQSNHYAVAAWLRKGEAEAARIETRVYSRRLFNSALRAIRSLTAKPPEIFEPEMRKISADAGVAVVFKPEIPGTHVYGATRWLKATKPLIQLSLRGKSDDHFWFSFFHEAGHILLHRKDEVFIETTDQDGTRRDGIEKEQEADQFSRDFLIPPKEYHTFLEDRRFNLTSIQRFAANLGITPGIVVGRLQHEKVIPFNQGNSLKKRFKFGNQ